MALERSKSQEKEFSSFRFRNPCTIMTRPRISSIPQPSSLAAGRGMTFSSTLPRLTAAPVTIIDMAQITTRAFQDTRIPRSP